MHGIWKLHFLKNLNFYSSIISNVVISENKTSCSIRLVRKVYLGIKNLPLMYKCCTLFLLYLYCVYELCQQNIKFIPILVTITNEYVYKFKLCLIVLGTNKIYLFFFTMYFHVMDIIIDMTKNSCFPSQEKCGFYFQFDHL